MNIKPLSVSLVLVIAAAALGDAAPPVSTNSLTVTITVRQDTPITPVEKRRLEETIQTAVSESLATRAAAPGTSIRFQSVQEAPGQAAPAPSPEGQLQELANALDIQRQLRDEMLKQLLISKVALERKIATDPIATHLKLIIRRLEYRFHDLAEIFEGNLIKQHEVEQVEAQLLSARIELAHHLRALQQGPESLLINELQQQIFQKSLQITEMELRLRQLASPAGEETAPSDNRTAPRQPRKTSPEPNLKVAQS